jgi:hypothetical protein
MNNFVINNPHFIIPNSLIVFKFKSIQKFTKLNKGFLYELGEESIPWFSNLFLDSSNKNKMITSNRNFPFR